jgi:hypothetical protein
MKHLAQDSALKVYNHYYQLAIKDFDNKTADYLARLPADYVYNSLLNSPGCYINEHCCLEYCNERIDYDFNTLDPALKRKVYEKAFSVNSGNISEGEINLKLKSKRKDFKNLFYKPYNQMREQKENILNISMSNLSIKRKNTDNLENSLKSMKLK